MEQLVRVKETYDDGTALVFRIRESACSGDCHKCSGCGALVGGLGFARGIALVLVYDRKVAKKANIDYTITAFARKS